MGKECVNYYPMGMECVILYITRALIHSSTFNNIPFNCGLNQIDLIRALGIKKKYLLMHYYLCVLSEACIGKKYYTYLIKVKKDTNLVELYKFRKFAHDISNFSI